jgi:TetR/AcrR family transcriptional repressor of nem operon
MPRASREQRALNHERVLEHASRLVRERGASGFSVPELMAAAGLTQGGFYKHFASKDDLLAEAGAAAFAARLTAMVQLAETAADRDAARAQFVGEYLSAGHRDDPGHGCASAALAADAARRDPDDPLRHAFTAGLRDMTGALQALHADDAADEPGSEVLAEIATLVGAVVLARATAGDDISDRILSAAREHLLGYGPTSPRRGR